MHMFTRLDIALHQSVSLPTLHSEAEPCGQHGVHLQTSLGLFRA